MTTASQLGSTTEISSRHLYGNITHYQTQDRTVMNYDSVAKLIQLQSWFGREQLQSSEQPRKKEKEIRACKLRLSRNTKRYSIQCKSSFAWQIEGREWGPAGAQASTARRDIQPHRNRQTDSSSQDWGRQQQPTSQLPTRRDLRN